MAEVEGALTGDGALRRAVDEARLRQAPLRVLTTWQVRYPDIHDKNAVADGNRLAKARLDRRLTELKTRHPDLDIQAVAVHGNFVNYLAKTRPVDPIGRDRPRPRQWNQRPDRTAVLRRTP